MKRLLTILTALLPLLNAMATGVYTEKSVLSEGSKWVKIRISETGVYKLTGSELRSMGMTPSTMKIYGYGGAMLDMSMSAKHIDDLPQVPFYMSASSDSRFADSDYVLFYAQGPVSWTYTGSRFRHIQNPYSSYGYYFLTNAPGEQLLLEPKRGEPETAGTEDVYTLHDYQVHELDSVNLVDTEGKDGGGREWYGESFTGGKQRKFDFTFRNIKEADMYCYVDVAANSLSQSKFTFSCSDQSSEIYVAAKPNNGTTMATVASYGEMFTPKGGEKQTITLSYTASLDAAVGYLNYIELTAECEARVRDGILYLRNPEYYRESVRTMFHVRGANAMTQVWNVTRKDSIYSVPCRLEGDEISFTAKNDIVEEFVVINPSEYAGLSITPFTKSQQFRNVANQNLHALSDIDMVIITPEAFVSASQRLAAEHEKKDGFRTAVVTDEQIYNEFSSGTPDATAYRMMMKMLYDRALESGSEHNPKYLLLMGDGSFDNRKLSLVSPTPVLLTYQSANSVDEAQAYATDDYFGWLTDETGGNRDSMDSMSIAVGRLPIREETEADAVVDKIIRYMENATPGKWKTQLCFLSDDGNSGLHTKSSEKAAELIRSEAKELSITKIYIDAYQQETRASGESYPLAKSKLDNLLNNGILFFDYCGHAGYNNLSDEQMLTTKQIQEMTNVNLGFWMLATCNFARFDARVTSAAEWAVLNKDGGAVGLLAACRTVFAEQNDVLNKYVCQQMFSRSEDGRFCNTIGDAVRKAKRLTTEEKGGDRNKLSYILLGDPALRLVYPDEFLIETASVSDTIRALSVQEVSGYIKTHEGDTATDFNGKLYVTIYDKQQQLKTLDNDQPQEEQKVRVGFLDFPNMLFSGETDVKDGKFQFSFMVPKDIRYNFGNGRMTYYAKDTVVGGEAVGYYEDMVIGGSLDVEIVDTVGPDVHVYLNNKRFLSGDRTNTKPHFYADVSDESGINTVGSGIGHDLLLVVDDDKKQTYILNESFAAKSGSYQDGRVSFKMNELSEGQHSLMFRAWDLVNNSTTATLDFEVVQGLNPEIFSLLVYPNPVETSGLLRVVVDHDRPDAALQTEVYVYDIAGSCVYTESRRGVENISLTPATVGMRPGVYFLRVMLKTEDSSYVSKATKIIVL